MVNPMITLTLRTETIPSLLAGNELYGDASILSSRAGADLGGHPSKASIEVATPLDLSNYHAQFTMARVNTVDRSFYEKRFLENEISF
jgi:hypothetical protein